jgi:hypothetical protein
MCVIRTLYEANAERMFLVLADLLPVLVVSVEYAWMKHACSTERLPEFEHQGICGDSSFL